MLDDKCEEIEGKYRVEFKNDGVEFILIKDECNRSKDIPGFFSKYVEPLTN